MSIKKIRLETFRSYPRATFNFANKANLIVGRNGAGKTNLLEAIYLLASARSFRGKDVDMIRTGSQGYSVEGQTSASRLQVSFSAGKKILKLNQKAAQPDRFVGRLPAVLFEPKSVNIVAGAPEDRRRFLNRLLAAVDSKYLRVLINYRRVVRQRNALLRQRPADLAAQIFGWDIKLVELASYIYSSRQQLLQRLTSGASSMYEDIANSRNIIQLTYSYQSPGDYTESLMKALQANLGRDSALGHTSVGPHRDDVIISFDELLVTSVASRGEQRTLTLALKIMELMYLEEMTKQKPLVLLDDVFSELDGARRRALTGFLEDYQTFITTTDADVVAHNFAQKCNIIPVSK